MKSFITLLLVNIVIISGCQHKSEYRVYKTSIPLSTVLFFTLHIGEDEYMMSVPDGVVSTGKVEKKANYYILTDELSNEVMFAKREDDFFIFMNGRYSNLIIAEDKRTEKEKDFESEMMCIFSIKNEDIVIYRKGLISKPGSSLITLPARLDFTNQDNLRLYLNDDSSFSYWYCDLLIETGEYTNNGNEIILSSYEIGNKRFDLSDKEKDMIKSLIPHVFKVYIIDSNTVNLGTLPYARINNIAKLGEVNPFFGY